MQPNRHDKAAPAGAQPGSDRCAWALSRRFDYLDGELSADEQQAVEAHLDACAACRREMALSHQSEQALTSALQTVPPAGDMRAAFYTRLAASQASSRRRWTRWRLALPAVAAGLIVAMLWRPASVVPTGETPGERSSARSHPPETADTRTPAFVPFAGDTAGARLQSDAIPAHPTVRARAPEPDAPDKKGGPEAAQAAPFFKSGSAEAVGAKPAASALQLKVLQDEKPVEAASRERETLLARRATLFDAPEAAPAQAAPELKTRTPALLSTVAPKSDSGSAARADDTRLFADLDTEVRRKSEAETTRGEERALGLKAERLETLAENLPLSYNYFARSGVRMGRAAGGEPPPEVSLQVQDDVRGFTASTDVRAAVEEDGDGAVVTIQADDTHGDE